MNTGSQTQPGPQLELLLNFLEQDPVNPSLLSNAAFLAFQTGDLSLCGDLIERFAAIRPLSRPLQNLRGLLAIAQRQFDEAVGILAELRIQGPDDPALRFNLAWAHAMMGNWQEALDLLDQDSLAVSPRGPALKIQLLHHLGRLEDALACGKLFAETSPKDTVLMGALANVAIDAEKADLAAGYARLAGDDTGGLTAAGTLALARQDVAGSLASFESALKQDPANPRALIGKGLGLLSNGDLVEAAKAIDRGAELFRTHLGSWVASGWAFFLMQDYGAARARFERAKALDPNFAEIHGGLAVLDIAEGRLEDASRACEIAVRLDRNCFGAALAKSLLLQRRGQPEMAHRIVQAAMATPIGPDGRTLAQMLAGLGGTAR